MAESGPVLPGQRTAGSNEKKCITKGHKETFGR